MKTKIILPAALILVLLGILIFVSACGKSDGEISKYDPKADTDLRAAMHYNDASMTAANTVKFKASEDFHAIRVFRKTYAGQRMGAEVQAEAIGGVGSEGDESTNDIEVMPVNGTFDIGVIQVNVEGSDELIDIRINNSTTAGSSTQRGLGKTRFNKTFILDTAKDIKKKEHILFFAAVDSDDESISDLTLDDLEKEDNLKKCNVCCLYYCSFY